MMRSLRRNKRMVKIPIIILVVALSVGLVGSFTLGSVPNLNLPAVEQGTSGPGLNEQAAELSRSIRQLTQGLKNQPENISLLTQLGIDQVDLSLIKANLGETEQATALLAEAVTTWQRAVALEPDNGLLQLKLAETANLAGDKELASSSYAKAIGLDPNNLDGRINYGFLLREDKQFEAAISQWQAVIDLNPDPQTSEQLSQLINQAKEIQLLQAAQRDPSETSSAGNK